MSDEMKPCPHCQSPYGYAKGQELYACPECGHGWNPMEPEAETRNQEGPLVKDSKLAKLNSILLKSFSSSAAVLVMVRMASP